MCAQKSGDLLFHTNSGPRSLPKFRAESKGDFSAFSNALRYSIERRKKKKEVKAWIF